MNGFKTPTSEEVRQALRRIPTLQLRRVFFEGNNNPMWVRPLAAAGAFNSPPEPVAGDDGYIRESYWPEIDYLTRMAEIVPEDVVEVLRSLSASGNSWVRRAMFEIGAKIPAVHAALLVPMIIEWGAGRLGWRTDPRSQVSMVKNLLDDEQAKAGVRLANLLFRPRQGGEHKEVAVGLEEYWYTEELPRVVDSLGAAALRTVMPWLVEYEQLRGSVTDEFDASGLSRSAIGTRDHSYPSIEHALIDAVRDAAIDGIAATPEASITLISRPSILLLRRITLFAAAEALSRMSQEGRETAPIVSPAKALLFEPLSSDDSCRVEFAQLVKAIASVAPDELKDLPAIIRAGPFGSSTALRERLRRQEDDEDSLDERVRERTATWQHRLLAAIGSESLPPELQQKLSELDSEFGVIELPLAPDIGSSSWSGPTSPSTQDELSAMNSEELAAHLESWRAGDGWRGPTHEGQGRELTTLISTKPLALRGIANLIDRLRPTYLRALLSGWEAAIKAGITPDWDQLVIVTLAVLERTEPSPFPPEGNDFDDDRDYRHAKHAGIGLLEEAAKKREDFVVPERVMEQLAEILISATENDEAWREYSEADSGSGMDPLTTSLNWRWSISVRGLANLLTHGSGSPWYSEALSALERELKRPDQRGASRAVMGESLAKLYNNALEWLKANLTKLFGGNEGISVGQQVALTTALATHRYHKDVFELLREPLSAALRLDEPIAVGWKGQFKPNDQIGQWIVGAFLSGDVDLNDSLVQDFFALVSPETRGKTLGHIAWQFMHMKSADTDITQRLGELWDHRVAHVREHPEDTAELGDFYWFVKSGKYAPAWWLPRLIEAAELHGDLNSHGMVGEILADAAPAYPRESLDALQLLLRQEYDPDGRRYDLTEHAAPAVIAAGFSSKDEQLKKDARGFMNALGARGYLELEQRVQAMLEPPRKSDA
ncbi:hypothetical protein GCM10023346_22660 [Arthrobacter gyeryongensis]|uniref:Uncharacterized protein n=1 Tax=Arthrobacter gyeryongensis TaxID=1650592 RepID=A0ABP9SDR3_9MICC